jgi:HEAT repeat protein
VEAIATGEDVDGAGDRMVALGKPGLWAIHAAAKKASGETRARLFESIGRFGTDEAEWALIVELKNSDVHGKAGALRGLTRMKRPRTANNVINHAATESALVRDAAADYFVAIGDAAARPHAVKMYGSADAKVRELAVAYAIRTSESTFAAETLPKALRDPSPRVRMLGLELAERAGGKDHIFTIAELARSEESDVSDLAARVLAGVGGAFAATELSSIVAAAPARPASRQHASGCRRRCPSWSRRSVRSSARRKKSKKS